MHPTLARRLARLVVGLLVALGAWTAFVAVLAVEDCAGLVYPDSATTSSRFDGCGPGDWTDLTWQDVRTDWVVGALALAAVGTASGVVMVEAFRPPDRHGAGSGSMSKAGRPSMLVRFFRRR